MKNFKSFGFWTALAGAVTMLASALGKCFGFSVDNQVVTDVIMAIAGVLVVLGVVTMPKKESTKNNETDETPEKEKQQESEKSNQEDE